MTAAEALQLSLVHKLGSADNTLVPGVVVPAYRGGDPNAWATRVQAIGLSRLLPVGSAGSKFKTVRDAVAPMWTGGNTTQVVAKDPQEQESAVRMIVNALRPVGADGGSTVSPFSIGRWIFGDSIGAANAGLVSSQNSDRQYALERDRFNLDVARTNASLAEAARRSSIDEAIQRVNLANTDRAFQFQKENQQNNLAQLQFADALQLAQLTQGQLDAQNAARVGMDGVTAQAAAATAMGDAIAAYNARAAEIADAANKAQADTVLLEFGNDGLARLKPGKFAGATANKVMAEINASPEAKAVRKAQQDALAAQLKLQTIPYLPRANVAVPKVPTFTAAPATQPAATVQRQSQQAPARLVYDPKTGTVRPTR